ncbi:uncharacterized protein LOC110435329 isoform X2 [Sorghum bicolor]|uniref:Uncharacterized protein n=1 Tax=Sorghum bicolor TaxID=4558 RepID=A0A1Z5RH52_SORBI|nr:uncharacterized protein LOC110435329 isoform X2 [Sorghum bicolor]OQU83090.1 hypothetical protein SORBI_3005G075500 [Sorghum bicolor]|eukprot:XP_021316455.1 uncharacterized protein LOC110435329 isoform X2 [Sorghum bicolor]
MACSARGIYTWRLTLATRTSLASHSSSRRRRRRCPASCRVVVAPVTPPVLRWGQGLDPGGGRSGLEGDGSELAIHDRELAGSHDHRGSALPAGRRRRRCRSGPLHGSSGASAVPLAKIARFLILWQHMYVGRMSDNVSICTWWSSSQGQGAADVRSMTRTLELSQLGAIPYELQQIDALPSSRLKWRLRWGQ